MTEDILVQRDTPIATITINRPAQRNAVSYVMWLELSQLLESLDDDPDVRAIIFTGAGDRAFSAGADISDFDEHRADGAKAKAYNEAVDQVLAKLADMRTPTISMIRGFAVGGGCELAVATDLRIASEDSRMGIPAARLGITIGHQEMQGLVNLVGKGTALYILLSARLLDAQEALRVGLVNQVVPTEELHEYTYKLAQDIAALAPLSHAVNKLTLRQVQAKPDLADLTPEESSLPLGQFETQDYVEGYRAFLEKRAPRFIGK